MSSLCSALSHRCVLRSCVSPATRCNVLMKGLCVLIAQPKSWTERSGFAAIDAMKNIYNNKQSSTGSCCSSIRVSFHSVRCRLCRLSIFEQSSSDRWCDHTHYTRPCPSYFLCAHENTVRLCVVIKHMFSFAVPCRHRNTLIVARIN